MWDKSVDFIEWLHQERRRMERERREDGRRSSSEQAQELKRLQAKGFRIEWRPLPVKSDMRKTL